MSVAEIDKKKSDLIEWIKSLSDTTMLDILSGLKESTVGEDWWDKLSDKQKKRINEGLTDAGNGRVMPSEEFWNKLANG